MAKTADGGSTEEGIAYNNARMRREFAEATQSAQAARQRRDQQRYGQGTI